MKGIVAEIKGKYAVILTQDGLFKKVRALPGMTVGMEAELGRPAGAVSGRRFAARVASIAAAGLLVLGVGLGAYSYTVPYSYVDIDINPSVELAVNIYDRIIGAEALNEDGERLLKDKDLRNKKLDIGVGELLNRAVEQGYLKAEAETTDSTGGQDGDGGPAGNSGQVPGNGSQTSGSGSQSGTENGSNASDSGGQDTGTSMTTGGGRDPAGSAAPAPDRPETQEGTEESGGGPVIKNAVMVTVSSNNSKKSGELRKKIASTASKELGKDRISSEILVGEASNRQREAARKLGVTPGKLTLIEDALKYLPEKDIEDVKDTAVKDLIEIARNNNKKNARTDTGASGKKDSGTDAGKKGGSSDKGNGSTGSKSDSTAESGNSGGNKINDKNENPENSRSNAGSSKITAPAGKQGKDDKVSGSKSGTGNSAGDSIKKNTKNDTGNSAGDNTGNSSVRKENQNEKKQDSKAREMLDKSDVELRKENERLKNDLLRQIEDRRHESGKGRTGQDDDENRNGDKDSKKNREDKDKDQKSGKNSGPENDNRGMRGQRK